jgi:endonuclease/exonuclease/phosphatase family metal-dependent hydrolase
MDNNTGKNMKIMTFNIWRYDGDWSKRKPNIIEAVKKENPDVLFMQEVFDDQRYQAKDGPHQGEQLNEKLYYKNMVYDIVEQTITEHKQDLRQLVFDGLLCLTNLPILEHKIVRLKREDSDKHYRAIQIVKVLWYGKELVFYHTHYSNTKEWSKLHLQETKEYLIRNKVSPIILGDLNILEPEIITEVLGDKFECSYEIEKYVSFPAKNEVLDYIVIPKEQYKFKGIKCDYDNCSDHRALIAEIVTI